MQQDGWTEGCGIKFSFYQEELDWRNQECNEMFGVSGGGSEECKERRSELEEIEQGDWLRVWENWSDLFYKKNCEIMNKLINWLTLWIELFFVNKFYRNEKLTIVLILFLRRNFKETDKWKSSFSVVILNLRVVISNGFTQVLGFKDFFFEYIIW